jgi:hypothetical protein
VSEDTVASRLRTRPVAHAGATVPAVHVIVDRDFARVGPVALGRRDVPIADLPCEQRAKRLAFGEEHSL